MSREEEKSEDLRRLRAALKSAGAPLLAAPGDLAARVLAPGERTVPAAALAGLALAGALAALLLLVPGGRDGIPPSGQSLTQAFYNPFGAAVPGEASGTDFLYRLSARSESGPGAGPAPLNLKEGL